GRLVRGHRCGGVADRTAVLRRRSRCPRLPGYAHPPAAAQPEPPARIQPAGSHGYAPGNSLCYAAVLLPVPADGFVTAGLMAALAVLAGPAVRRAAADRRPVVLTVALAAGTLAVTWWLAAAGTAGGDGLTLANDIALIVAAVAVVAGS